MDKQYLNEREVSNMTGLSVFTLRNNRSLRKGINYFKIGKSVRYSIEDVSTYFNSQKILISGDLNEKIKRKGE